ncbi:MAG: DUF6069 family protein [Chloroflexota bacterium]
MTAIYKTPNMQNYIPSKIIWVGILISIISILANLIFFALTKAFGEQYIIPLTDVASITGPMPVVMVILVTFLSSLLATALYGFLNIITPNAILPPFLSITGTAFLVSFGGPMELPETVMQTKILLCMMHIIAALIIIGGFYIYHLHLQNPIKIS